MAKAKSLETAFEELDALAAKMEDRDLPLEEAFKLYQDCLLYTSPSPRDAHESRMPSSA